MKRTMSVLTGLMLISSTAVTHSPRAAIMTVTNANDSGAGSLRQAILDANGTGGADVIQFNILPAGRYTIDLVTPLPAITEAVNVDGTTQPGFGATPMIELNGSSIGVSPVLTLSAGSSTIQGLAFTRGQDSGIRITTGANNHIDWCAVGSITRENFQVAEVPGMGNAGPGIDVVGGTGLLVERTRMAFNGASGIVVRAGATGVNMSQVELYSNTGLQFDLNGDGPTPNDVGDGDTGGNTLLNSPILERVHFRSAESFQRKVMIFGRLEAAPLTAYSIRIFFGRIGANHQFEVTNLGGGGTGGLTTDASGIATFNFGASIENGVTAIALATMDAAQNTSEFSNPIEFPDIVADSGCGAVGLEWLIVPVLAAFLRRRRRDPAV